MITNHQILRGGPEAIRPLQQQVLDAVESRAFPAAACFAIRLALEEALANAHKHGNQGDPDKAVELEYRIGPDDVTIRVRDEGPGFDPGAVPDPTAAENIEIPSGRGIVLMRAYMTEVEYEDGGKCVKMRYVRPEDSAGTGTA